jgi:hypothetical protein
MIPRSVAEVLDRLPRNEVERRLVRDGDRRYLELGPEDGELRLRLGIETDKLGPAQVVVRGFEVSVQDIFEFSGQS